MSNQVIKVTNINGSEATLYFGENNVKVFSTKAIIGKNGINNNKKEGEVRKTYVQEKIKRMV